MSNSYSRSFVAEPRHIDVMGHVNNTVWLGWVQDIAIEHWEAAAQPEHAEAYVWVVTRHEIDYRGNIAVGEAVEAVTFIPDPPRGARFDRCVEFRDEGGKLLVSARSTWAMLDRATGQLQRIPAAVAAPFLPNGD